MGKKRHFADNVDAEDLNHLFQMGFGGLEELDSALADTRKGSQQWSIRKMPKITGKPLPEFDAGSWQQHDLSKALLAGICEQGFAEPTDIQRAVLSNMQARYLVGSAPTGSGKTLAFSLPILHTLSLAKPADLETTHLYGLVLCPTRELAIQVAQHLQTAAKYIAGARFATVVGGMSEEKQKRLLSYSPTIIIATPGRLAELAEFDVDLRKQLRATKFLVIDEADRMVLDKQSRFPDLEKLFRYVLDGPEKRIFLFSATLSSGKLKTAFALLRKRLGMENPVRIHLDKQIISLSEYKACLLHHNDKDKWLFEALCNPNGKSIIFVNSIEAVRRLHLILSLLLVNVVVCPLHAQMQQRQRLKYLDRFRQSSHAVLVCSDVAARGLDIPAVDMVIQAEPPRNMDTNKHRIGRTARAGNSGTTCLLLSPKDAAMIKASDELKDLLKLPEKNMQWKPNIESIFSIVYEIEHLAFVNRRREKEYRLLSKARQDIGIDADEFSSTEDELRDSKQIGRLKAQLNRLLKDY